MNNINSRNIFHLPYNNNNFRVYVRNDIDLDQTKKYLTNLYVELNRADGALKEWFEKMNEQFQFSAITVILKEWTKKLEMRQNLVGVYHAMAILSELEKNKINTLELLQGEQPQLIDNFTKLPEELLTVTRINQCVPYEDLPTVFNQLCSEVLVDPRVKTMVERVEMLLSPPEQQNIKYPTLVIYLDSKALRISQDLNYMLEKLDDYFTRYPQKNEIDNTFADPWNSFVNVTQGFKLHKVYLNALRVIDRVYSRESGFAYRIQNDHSPHVEFGLQTIKSLLSVTKY